MLLQNSSDGLRRWRNEAVGFYTIISAATVIGFAVGFLPINPIQLLVLDCGHQWNSRRPYYGSDDADRDKSKGHGEISSAAVACLGGLGGDSTNGHHCGCPTLVTALVSLTSEVSALDQKADMKQCRPGEFTRSTSLNPNLTRLQEGEAKSQAPRPSLSSCKQTAATSADILATHHTILKSRCYRMRVRETKVSVTGDNFEIRLRRAKLSAR